MEYDGKKKSRRRRVKTVAIVTVKLNWRSKCMKLWIFPFRNWHIVNDAYIHACVSTMCQILMIKWWVQLYLPIHTLSQFTRRSEFRITVIKMMMMKMMMIEINVDKTELYNRIWLLYECLTKSNMIFRKVSSYYA